MDQIISWLKSWTNGGSLSILIFPILAILLLWSSLKIVKYSEIMIARTKMGGGFIGATLIATVTSAPELITEVTQAAGGAPENGLGDDIGSNALSIFLIGVGGLIAFRQMFLNKLSKWTKFSIFLSFIMMSSLSILLIVNKDVNLGPIGIIPMLFFGFYLLTIFLTWKFDREGDNDGEFSHLENEKLKPAIIKFVIFALLVILFAVMVNINVSAFQEGLGIDTKSAGGVFLAITTSLPEVVAFFAFLKKGFPGAAIASLVGSHFFNIGIMFFGDLTYSDGPTFNLSSMSEHYPLAIMSAVMLGLLLVQFALSKKYRSAFSKKSIYMIIPSIITVGYFVGWAMILSFN